MVPLHDMKVGVGFSVSVKRIPECIFFLDTVNSEMYNGQIITPFFVNLSEVEEEYEFCQQDGSTTQSQ